jgi:hypothetical protein
VLSATGRLADCRRVGFDLSAKQQRTDQQHLFVECEIGDHSAQPRILQRAIRALRHRQQSDHVSLQHRRGGLDFAVAGFADFNQYGTTDMMLRNKNTGTLSQLSASIRA